MIITLLCLGKVEVAKQVSYGLLPLIAVSLMNVRSDQGKDEDVLSKVEEPTPVCGAPDARSMIDQCKTQERPNNTDKSTVRESSHGYCDREPTKRKILDSDGVSSDPDDPDV
jgi:hypothetical protein